MNTYLDIEKLKADVNKITGMGYITGSDGNTEFVTKCPLCELNSKKTHGHLYLSLDYPVFNCFRCNESGTIYKYLNLFNLKHEDYIDKDKLTLHNYNSSIKNISKIHLKINKDVKKIDLKLDNDKFKEKIIYLKKRLGENFKFENIPNLVLDTEKFILENQLTEKMVYINNKNMIDNKMIGFITNFGSCIVLRNIDETSNLRYLKFQIKNINNKYPDFYGFQTKDFSCNIPKIIITEGIFDLLCAFKYCKELRNTGDVWAACLSKNFNNAIYSILDFYNLISCEIYILSDSDVSLSEYSRLFFRPEVKKIRIFYNKNKKDFGETEINIVEISPSKYQIYKNFLDIKKKKKMAN